MDEPTSPVAMSPKTKPVPVSPTVDVVRRRVIVFSFWAMALLGVPYWYNSTAIERLELPNAEVESWLSRGVSRKGPPRARRGRADACLV